MDRRQFLQGVGMSAIAASSPFAVSGATGKAGSERPNFLIIMSDQHSSHVLGCAGDPVVQTPNLDHLSSRAVTLQHAYCASPVCVPSRAAFLTGQPPSSSRVWSNTGRLSSDIPTFAHALETSGYDTTLIGRMLFYGMDQLHGFRRRLLGDMVQYPYNAPPMPKEMMQPPLWATGYGTTAFQAYDEAVTATTLQFLRDQSPRSGPFCAVVGFLLPHGPNVCPKPEWEYYYDRVKIPECPSGYFDHLHPAMKQWRKAMHLENLRPEQVRAARTGYYGLISVLDRNIGRILSELERQEFARNTVVIYTSDHGDSAGENGLWFKMNMYEGAVTVPLMVSCPQRWKPGKRDKITSLIDVAPTLLELGQATTLPQATGHSLVPLLENRGDHWANEAFSEYPPANGVPLIRMVRTGKWKLVYFHGFRPQLFNLENDPHEFEDLGDNPEFAEIREKLLRRILSGWPADQVNQEIIKQQAAIDLVKKWEAQVRPPSTLVWQAPSDANRYTQVPPRGPNPAMKE